MGPGLALVEVDGELEDVASQRTGEVEGQGQDGRGVAWSGHLLAWWLGEDWRIGGKSERRKLLTKVLD